MTSVNATTMLGDPTKIGSASLRVIYDDRCVAASSELVIGLVRMPSMSNGTQQCADAFKVTKIGGIGFVQDCDHYADIGIIVIGQKPSPGLTGTSAANHGVTKAMPARSWSPSWEAFSLPQTSACRSSHATITALISNRG